MERRWQRLRAARSEAVHAALDHATAATAEAAFIRGVLRTLDVHVDRNKVMVAYQLHDAHGNVRVKTQGLAVEYALSASGMSALTTSCNTTLQAATHFLGHCVLRHASAL